LKRQIEKCFLDQLGPGKLPEVEEKGARRIVGLVCPHAGYMYSGPVAAYAYYELALDGKPEVVILLGPNHMGYGSGLAIMKEGSWRTPLGDVEIDTETADKILKETNILDVDEVAHSYEHSIEVQLPFLQYLYGNYFRIVPIAFLMQDLTSSREIGEAIAKALENKSSLIVASSDMTHYEPYEIAKKKDLTLIKTIEELNEEKLYSVIEAYRVSCCGYGPVAALVVAAKLLGVKEAKLLCYRSSGDVIGDYSSVVGYAAISFTKGA
jgi:hypothetical protein